MAAAGNGKKKRKIYFILGNGSFSTEVHAPGDRKVDSTWNPGRSRKKDLRKF